VFTVALHTFFFFVVFNATVVFESGAVRWMGLALCVGLASLWSISRKRNHDVAHGHTGL